MEAQMESSLMKVMLVGVFLLALGSGAHAQSVPPQGEPVIPSTPIDIDPKLQDFSRISQVLGKRIRIVEHDGKEREGVLASATADGITMRFGKATQSYSRADVFSAETIEDSTLDGALGGAVAGLFACVLSLAAGNELEPLEYAANIVSFAGAGALLDARQSHRETLYHSSGRPPSAPSLPGATVLAFRLRF